MKQRSVVAGVFFGIWLFVISAALVAVIAFAVVKIRHDHESDFKPTRANCHLDADPSFAPADEVERDHFGACEAAGAFH